LLKAQDQIDLLSNLICKVIGFLRVLMNPITGMLHHESALTGFQAFIAPRFCVRARRRVNERGSIHQYVTDVSEHCNAAIAQKIKREIVWGYMVK